MLKLHKSKSSNKKKKGQSTIEYVLLVGAVIAALVAFLGKSDSVFRKAIDATLETTVNDMQSMANKLDNSH